MGSLIPILLPLSSFHCSSQQLNLVPLSCFEMYSSKNNISSSLLGLKKCRSFKNLSSKMFISDFFQLLKRTIKKSWGKINFWSLSFLKPCEKSWIIFKANSYNPNNGHKDNPKYFLSYPIWSTYLDSNSIQISIYHKECWLLNCQRYARYLRCGDSIFSSETLKSIRWVATENELYSGIWKVVCS
jgi:hypothetical protein